MARSFFSLIVPIYNTENFLKECIKSIMNQTFKDFQLILVNDGSTDNSPIICDEYKKLYKGKIEVIHKKNEGQLATRLKGLELAKGEYIYFVDSDDTIEPNLLSDVYSIINKYNTDIVLFNWQFIDKEGNYVSNDLSIFQEGFIEKEKIIKEIIKSQYLNSLCIKVCKKDLFVYDFDYSNLFYIKRGEDLIQSLNVLFKANSFYYLNKSYYNYRLNPDSVTRNFNKLELKSIIDVNNYIYKYLCKSEYYNSDLKKSYYRLYFNTVWEKLFLYYTKIAFKNQNYIEDFNYLYSNSFKIKHWLRHISLPILKKIGILLFFWKHWPVLHVYYYLVYIFYTCGIKRLKDIFVKK